MQYTGGCEQVYSSRLNTGQGCNRQYLHVWYVRTIKINP